MLHIYANLVSSPFGDQGICKGIMPHFQHRILGHPVSQNTWSIAVFNFHHPYFISIGGVLSREILKKKNALMTTLNVAVCTGIISIYLWSFCSQSYPWNIAPLKYAKIEQMAVCVNDYIETSTCFTWSNKTSTPILRWARLLMYCKVLPYLKNTYHVIIDSYRQFYHEIYEHPFRIGR